MGGGYLNYSLIGSGLGPRCKWGQVTTCNCSCGEGAIISDKGNSSCGARVIVG